MIGMALPWGLLLRTHAPWGTCRCTDRVVILTQKTVRTETEINQKHENDQNSARSCQGGLYQLCTFAFLLPNHFRLFLVLKKMR